MDSERLTGLMIVAGALFFLWLYDSGRWEGFQQILLGKPATPGPLAANPLPVGYSLVSANGVAYGTAGPAKTGIGSCTAGFWLPGCPSTVHTGSNTLDSIVNVGTDVLTKIPVLGSLLGGLL